MAVSKWLHRGWSAFQILSTCTVLVIAVALSLAHLTEGAGAVIVQDAPARAAFVHCEEGKRKSDRCLRVPLGGSLHFETDWHVAQGGCQRVITTTYTLGDDTDGFSLRQRRIGDPYPIGQPGRHVLERRLPLGITPGLWRYHSEATSVCYTRTTSPVALADFDVEVFDPDGPVVLPIGEVKITTPIVPFGGSLAYRISYRRTEAIRSEVQNTFVSVGPTPSGTPDVVFEHRLTAGMGEGEHIDIDIATALPAAIHTGRWQISQVIVTTRPGGKTRYDPQFSFEFDVVAP